MNQPIHNPHLSKRVAADFPGAPPQRATASAVVPEADTDPSTPASKAAAAADDNSLEARLSRARAREAEILEAREREDNERELQVLDLKARGREECRGRGRKEGREGADFAVVEFRALNLAFLVRRPELSVIKHNDKLTRGGKQLSDEDMLRYVASCIVVPDAKELRSLVNLHPGIVFVLGLELKRLEGAILEDKAGER